MLINKKKNTRVVKKLCKVLRKCCENFTKNLKNLNFRKLLRKLYEGFVKSFMDRISLLFHVVVLYTAELDIRYLQFLKNLGGRGPQALVTLRLCI